MMSGNVGADCATEFLSAIVIIFAGIGGSGGGMIVKGVVSAQFCSKLGASGKVCRPIAGGALVGEPKRCAQGNGGDQGRAQSETDYRGAPTPRDARHFSV